MEFKKCARCGAFFISDDNVCCNCVPKDKLDCLKLQNYLEGNSNISSVEEIALNTGISSRNITRYLEGKNPLTNSVNGINNISINL